MRKTVFVLIIVLVLLIGAGIVHSALLGSAPEVKLRSAPSLAGIVSQSLDTAGGTANVPVAGKDFSLQNVRYFDNNSWVVASIKSLDSSVTSGTVVLQKKGGLFQVVLGPGTAFNNSYLLSLPGDVGQYLNKQGLIYGFSYQ